MDQLGTSDDFHAAFMIHGGKQTNNYMNSKEKLNKKTSLEHSGSNLMENNDILYALSETGSNSGMLIEKTNNSVRMQNNDIYHCLIF